MMLVLFFLAAAGFCSYLAEYAAAEEHRPGCLRSLADSYGQAAAFNAAEVHVSRIVRPSPVMFR